VDYHLRKVFRKTGVASRTQLARSMAADRPWDTDPPSHDRVTAVFLAMWPHPVFDGNLPRARRGVKGVDVVLVGRSAEREALGGLLARAAEGYSGALVLRGEAGVGKTALLDETLAAAAADGMQTARLTGVEPETQLGYAGLHRSLLPFSGQLEQLPVPQRDALRSTFGLASGPSADRFLVALAVLTLLAEVASAAPLVCVVDDVQWLDPESAVVLGFVARRLYAERVVLLFAVREPTSQVSALAGLPELMLGGLDEDAALELLASRVPGRLSPAVSARIFAETGGNPLALVEVARELSPGQLAGAEMLPEPLHIGGSLEKVFRRRIGWLPPETRLLLAVAAAEPAASQALVWRAAGQLGIDPDAAASADLSGLAEIGPQVQFRHPLVRSAAYYSAPVRQRRLIHQALAAADTGEQPDRVAWHLGMAASGPDEAVAARLEQAAERARERGGYAATVTFLSRAAELSAGEEPRARRLLAASGAAQIAGQPLRAGALLEEATPLLCGPLARAQARRLQGTICLALGQAGEAAPVLLEAARALGPADVRMARDALLEAVEAALHAGWSASRAVLSEIAAAARAMPARRPDASAADLLLDGYTTRAAAGYPAAVPLLRRAITMLRAADLSPQEGLRRLGLGCNSAADLFDDQAQHALATRWVQLARDHGALTALPAALNFQGVFAEVAAGRFDAARACFAEASEIMAATGNPGIVGRAGISEAYELAWRGRETEARRVVAEAAHEATGAGRGGLSLFAQYSLAVLELGLGNYQAALQNLLGGYEDDGPIFGALVLSDLVVAAARCGEAGLAEAALGRLAERALAAGTPLALGLLARSRALLAGDADAEPLYQEAIAYLQQCRSAPQLARAHLVHGEWLRRQRRRRDARAQLRAAHEMFESMGAGAFAERARIELLATGERARPRTAPAAEELTAQEAQIARLVSQGESNRDIAAQLFLSPSTVDYHLRKVFRKTGVASRTQLAHFMADDRLRTAGPALA
jgi:DNA-binding CsgD family transcriptional regulator